MNRRFAERTLICLFAGSVLVAAPGCSTTDGLAAADTLSLGRNAADDPCTASRTWRDRAVTGQFDSSYVLTCRSVTASRPVGYVRAVLDRPEAVQAIEAQLSCGEGRTVEIAGIGPVQARRCFDAALGEPSVALSYRRGGRRVIASALPSNLGPLEQAVRQLAGDAPPAADSRAVSSIDVAALAPAPAIPPTVASAADFNPSIALQRGISLNHKGLHLEASRVLNDALSRLPADATPAVRADLLLEAGLADSNIRYEEAAADHFARANELIGTPGADQPFLVRKRDTYAALDLLNRREFARALTALNRLAGPGTQSADPLSDPVIIQALNQPSGAPNDIARAVGVVDSGALSQLLLQAQAHWARSIAMLATGDVSGAEAALADAERSFAPVRNSRIDPVPVMWLQVRLDRQRGRIAVRRRDWAAADQSFDRALDALNRSALGRPGEGNAPAIADLRLERASIALQRGAPADEVQREYDAAIEALIVSGASGAPVSAGVDRYLRFLIDNMAGADREANQERFFRALQAAGESGVARQVNHLQSVLAADPALGARMRDHADLSRELIALRYEIAAVDARDAAQAARLAQLEARRRTVQTSLDALEAALGADARLSQVQERPATLAEIRAALRPGETYFKVAAAGGRHYGILVAPDVTHVYRVSASAAVVDEVARRVRLSIDGSLEQREQLVAFDVAAAHTLYTLLAGPAAERIAAARAVVVDPGGPLQSLPAAVLVTDRASVAAFRAQRRARDFDYSEVAFLAARAALSTTVSPRSFLASRRLPPSAAPRPFIAFAEPTPPPASEVPRTVDLGAGCAISYRELVALWGNVARLDDREARVAAQAVGAPGAEVVRGAAFTDSAVLSRDDLNQYKVLHFATHGFAEGRFGCANSPPALLTSLADADSNGLLSFNEIARLRLDANLVVLSACDTGAGIRSQSLARRSGQEEAGATLEGLVRAFLTANSRAVMATHWPASAGEEGIEFMRVFYETARGRPLGEALQTAQRRLLAGREHSHPFYWGAYFLVGDAGQMMLGGAPRTADTRRDAVHGAL
ncbi:MAG TPA: CHAT domain-containing protein [Allosphingosinicella sp.]|jgi:CHAT domain-containing protein